MPRSGFLGALAADPLGQRLSDQLVEAGVALDLVVVSERPTTLALAQLDAAGAAQYSFYTDTSMSDVWPAQVDELLPARLDALYVGSIGLVLEPAATAGLRAVELARARGALVMVDPNVRATLIADRAAYLARLDAVLGLADVLKLSVEDLAWLAPGEPSVVAARRFLDRGPRVVLLTAGADGATVFTGRRGRADRAGAGRGGGHDRRRATPSAPASSPTGSAITRDVLRSGKRFPSPGPTTLPASASRAGVRPGSRIGGCGRRGGEVRGAGGGGGLQRPGRDAAGGSGRAARP